MRHCVALGLGGITWLKNGQNWLRITNWLRFADILLLGNILIQLVCNLLEVTTSWTLCWLTIAIWFDVEVGEPISDHNIITFCVNVHPYLRKSSEKEFCDFNKAEWSRLNELNTSHGIVHFFPLISMTFGVCGWPCLSPPSMSASQKRGKRKIAGPQGSLQS